jgi:mRNA interferase RelE/StbE
VANYSILFTRSAAKELSRVPTKDRQRIVTKIGALAGNARPADAEKLSADEKYRIRQGNDRILYEIVDTQLIVTVVRIGNRREVYRR